MKEFQFCIEYKLLDAVFQLDVTMEDKCSCQLFFQDDFIFPPKQVIFSDYLRGKGHFQLNISLKSDIFLLFGICYVKSLHYFSSFLLKQWRRLSHNSLAI